MRELIRSLIYQKWFYGFLAVVLWLHFWTDVENVIDGATAREILALTVSTVAAILVTLIFVDLQLRWPPGDR
jgi:hypothetical protein